MSKRVPPDNDDWTRRYLRRLDIPCEGPQLAAALDSLDARQWQAMKAAWRKREEREHGPWSMTLDRVLTQDKRLGAVWLRLIAWGVISEEDALLLASAATSGGTTFSSNAGAKFCLAHALSCQVEATRREAGKAGKRELQKRNGAVAAFLRLGARNGLAGDALEEYVTAELSPHLGAAQV